MEKRGFRVIDADGHVVEPGDLWDRYMDKEYYGLRPRTNPNLHASIEVAGHWMSRSYEHQDFADDVNTKWTADYRAAEEVGYSPESQLAAMDSMGIAVMVCYPSRGLYAASVADLDGRLASAICRAYNRWLADFCATDPARLVGVALVGLQDPVLAAKEAEYAVNDLSMRGVMIRPNPYMGRNLHDPAYDDFYAKLVELDVPVATHEGCGVYMPQYGVDRFKEHIAWHAMCHPMEQMGAVLSFTMGGVMERHPDLRVGILEAGGTWLPYWLSRLDEHVEWTGDVETPYLTKLPSEYFRRQGWIGFEAEEPGLQVLVDYVGADRLLWASDYPHPDAKKDPLAELFSESGLSDEVLSQVLERNPTDFYHLREDAAKS